MKREGIGPLLSLARQCSRPERARLTSQSREVARKAASEKDASRESPRGVSIVNLRTRRERRKRLPTYLRASQPASLIYIPSPTQPCNPQKKAMSSSSVVCHLSRAQVNQSKKIQSEKGRRRKAMNFKTDREGEQENEQGEAQFGLVSSHLPILFASKFVCLYTRGPNTPRKPSVTRAFCHVLYKSSSRNL